MSMKKLLEDVGKDTLKGAVLHALAEQSGVTVTATAANVTAGNVKYKFTQAPKAVKVTVFTAAGVEKQYDGAVTKSGRTVTAANGGTNKFAATDVIQFRAVY